MANTAKNKARAEEAERMVKGSEVTLTADNYKSDFLHALNYYNANHDDKDKKNGSSNTCRSKTRNLLLTC